MKFYKGDSITNGGVEINVGSIYFYIEYSLHDWGFRVAYFPYADSLLCQILFLRFAWQYAKTIEINEYKIIDEDFYRRSDFEYEHNKAIVDEGEGEE